MPTQFNGRENWQPAADWLPEQRLTEPVATGSDAAAGLSPAELREMIRGYYQTRQWDAQGFVPARKLAELEIPASATW